MRSATSLGHAQEAENVFLAATFLNKTSLTSSMLMFTRLMSTNIYLCSHKTFSFREGISTASPPEFFGCININTFSPEPGQVIHPEMCNHSSHCPVQTIQAANDIWILIIPSLSSPVYSAVTEKLCQQPFINRTKLGSIISLKPRSSQEKIWMQWRAVCGSPQIHRFHLFSVITRDSRSLKKNVRENFKTERVLRHCNRLAREGVKSPSLKASRNTRGA